MKRPSLRQPPLADVQLGHDLEAGDDLFSNGDAGDRARVLHRSVDTQPDTQALRRALKVDVASAILESIVERRVEKADDRARLLAQMKRRQLDGVRIIDSSAEAWVEVGERAVAGLALTEHSLHGVAVTGDPAHAATLDRFEALDEKGVNRSIRENRQGARCRSREHGTPTLRFCLRPAIERELPALRWLRQEPREPGRDAAIGEASLVIDGHRGQTRDCGRAHCTCSTSWKIGRYMRTTTVPMTTPISNMSSGLTIRVTSSVRRASSSS